MIVSKQQWEYYHTIITGKNEEYEDLNTDEKVTVIYWKGEKLVPDTTKSPYKSHSQASIMPYNARK